jgi:FkbM family methyltransferase
MLQTLRSYRGVARSLRIYYGDRAGRAGLDSFYAPFVQKGDLVFDIGAHVGDRIGSFRRLGARVIAAEPQPVLVRTLRLLYGRDRGVTIEPVAVGAHTGTIALNLNIDNPTVSTASNDFMQAAADAPAWQGQEWTDTIRVTITTLDALIACHGRPSFIKIDVEGFEAEVLAGLTRAVPALSFEFTTIQPDVAAACIARCQALGYLRFNAVVGESRLLVHDEWLSAAQIADWLAGLPVAANSGDVYAKLA